MKTLRLECGCYRFGSKGACSKLGRSYIYGTTTAKSIVQKFKKKPIAKFFNFLVSLHNDSASHYTELTLITKEIVKGREIEVQLYFLEMGHSNAESTQLANKVAKIKEGE